MKVGDNMANSKESSKEMATLASKVLKDKRYSKISKALAASVLAQTKSK